jgi:hypothetical protein
MSENQEDSVELPGPVQTAMVFAARYTYDRQTAGAYAVKRALGLVWESLSETTQKQILSESKDATANVEDWERFRRCRYE